MELSTYDLRRIYNYKNLQIELQTLKKNYDSLMTEHSRELKLRDIIIEKKVEEKTKKYTDTIKDKDKQIEALKKEVAKLQSKLNNDSTNSGLPTSKTPIGKTKYIPNTREKTGKSKGGQKGHPKHKLIPFKEDEITEKVEILPTLCPNCQSKELEVLESSVDKQELDYDVVLIKRENKFKNCRCKRCNNVFHADIPNDLKEDIQYGKNIQSLAVCMTNEIYTPFNKTVKLINGMTNGGIMMSEGYVAKLQKRASNMLLDFVEEVKKHIINSPVFGWDDGVISIDKKEAILRTYCTDEVAMFIGHENKKAEGLENDGILTVVSKDTIVMHDHLLHNYNEKYNFDNVECVIHFIRRLKKMQEKTKDTWCEKMIELLSKTNTDRNIALKNDKVCFEESYLKELDGKFDKIIEEARKENNVPITQNYFKEEEFNFIEDIVKYKRNYLLWAYDFRLPSTNNNSERNIRPVKSKMKISGEFKNIEYARYYATIRTYIETCKKHNINIVEACVRLMSGKPYTLSEVLEYNKKQD